MTFRFDGRCIHRGELLFLPCPLTQLPLSLICLRLNLLRLLILWWLAAHLLSALL
jgi:hypothetical protein